MARRKTTTKRRKGTTTRRRRRISGMGSSPDVMTALAVVGGAVGARIINNMVQKQWPGTNLMLVAGGVGAAGWFLPKFVKNPLARGVGLGMVATAGLQLVVSTGVISGIGSPGDRMRYRISGGNLTNLHSLSGGVTTLNSVSGGGRRVAGVDDAVNPGAVFKGSFSERFSRRVNLAPQS